MYIEESEEVIKSIAHVKLNPVKDRMVNAVISEFIHPLWAIFWKSRFDSVEDDLITYQVYELF